MTQFERHLFICTSGRACPHQGAGEILSELRQSAKSAGITDRIRVNKAGCLAQCGYGPMVVVYPEGIWYAALRPGDGARIVAEHLVAHVDMRLFGNVVVVAHALVEIAVGTIHLRRHGV